MKAIAKIEFEHLTFKETMKMFIAKYWITFITIEKLNFQRLCRSDRVGISMAVNISVDLKGSMFPGDSRHLPSGYVNIAIENGDL